MTLSHTQELALIMAVPLITWIGFFVYVLIVDRTLRRLERNEKETDEL